MVLLGHPVQRGATHHHVEGRVVGHEGREVLHGPEHERLVGAGTRACLVDHRGLCVEPDDIALAHEVRDRAREVARAAAQVEHPLVALERQRLEERRVVHAMVPGVRRVVLPIPFGEECHACFIC